MDINLSSKLIRYAPAEVQTVTYVVEYAEHNCWDVRGIHEYIEAQLKSSRLIEIADIILESKNMATINAKPSGASAKIDSFPAEKSSTDSPATANQRTILGKGASSVKKEEVELGEEHISEEESDRMNDERLMRGGMGAGRGTTHTAAAKAKSTQSKSAKPDKNTAMSALEIVKRATEAKYGKGSIMSSYEAEGEDLDELYKGKHGQSEKEYQDGRSDAGKRISGDSQSGPNYYTKGRSRGASPDAPTKPGAKPANTPKLSRDEKEYHKYDKASAKGRREYNRVGGSKGLPEEYQLDEAGEDPCWKGYKQVGMKTKNGKEVPNCVPVTEAWMWELVDELAEDFDLLTQEDLEDLIIEAVVDLEDDAQMLDEALDIFTSYDVQPLFEDYYAAAAAKSKENSQKPEIKAAVRKAKVEKVKSAAKAVGSTLKSKADAIKSKASSAVSSAKDKASSAASSAKSAASSAKRGLKSIGKRAVGAASRAAGHAVGEYQAARIKSKRDSMSKTKPQSKPAASASKPESKDAETRRKGEALLDKIRSSGGQKTDSGSSSLSSGQRSSSTTTTTTRSGGGGGSSSSSGGSDKPSVLRRAASAVKRGVKKVVGVGARAVAKGAGYVAKRMGEETSWRDRLGFNEDN